MNHRLFKRKYLLGCAGKLGEVLKQRQVREYLIITLSTQFSVSFCFFLFLSVSFCFFLFLSVSFCFFLFLSISFCFFLFLSVSFCFLLFLAVSCCSLLFLAVSCCFLLFLAVSLFLSVRVLFCLARYAPKYFSTFLDIVGQSKAER